MTNDKLDPRLDPGYYLDHSRGIERLRWAFLNVKSSSRHSHCLYAYTFNHKAV